jgi:hypothetical protein
VLDVVTDAGRGERHAHVAVRKGRTCEGPGAPARRGESTVSETFLLPPAGWGHEAEQRANQSGPRRLTSYARPVLSRVVDQLPAGLWRAEICTSSCGHGSRCTAVSARRGSGPSKSAPAKPSAVVRMVAATSSAEEGRAARRADVQRSIRATGTLTARADPYGPGRASPCVGSRHRSPHPRVGAHVDSPAAMVEDLSAGRPRWRRRPPTVLPRGASEPDGESASEVGVGL